MVLHCGGRHGPQLWTGAQVKRGRRGLILPPHAIGVALRAARQWLKDFICRVPAFALRGKPEDPRQGDP